ncbi:hypothetical protein A1O3_07477 [Capronia epimyces CBS 606.96]|uniref:Uncharacterized protein n=1 Tax=Capronia epimyces CBS 606.96 TaxID=1182542 RepID=W9XKX5_9EURO|nr:uncharacterized protein A1O3_07477 [Capronia epimyces CBS 606.96]EXJ81187.1 hypothetical protein A1O3_07477 [Capronia epimyces CBS 606.96]
MTPSSGTSLVNPIKASSLLKLEGEGYLDQHLTTSTPLSVRSRGFRTAGLDDRLAAIWSGGRVVGIGTADLKEEDVGQEKTLLTLHHIASALLKHHTQSQFANQPPLPLRAIPPGSPSPPTIYAVVPHTYQTIPLLHALLAEKLSDSVAALELLKYVRLLQYFDLAGLAESLAEVSEGIFRRIQSDKQSRDKTVRDIVLIQGHQNAVSTIHRRSGLVQANALLSSLVRNITQISRMSRDVLVLVEAAVEPGLQAGEEARQDMTRSKRYLAGIELDSAFASLHGECLRLVCGSETLSRTLDVAFDTMVVVHDGFGRVIDEVRGHGKSERRIVEVVKDRLGDMTGSWGLWTFGSP